MKKIIILLLCSAPFMLFAQQRESRKLGAFNEVTVSQSIKLTLVKGNENIAEVITNGELEDVITEVSGRQLTVRKAPKNNWSGSNNDKVEVRVSYTDEIEYLQASSSASLKVEGELLGEELSVKASSSSKIKFSAKVGEAEIAASSSADITAYIETEELELKASSSSNIEIEGAVKELDASVSSSGNIDGGELTANKADVSASSSGSIKFNVLDKLKARASSSGKVTYGGSPQIKDVNSSSGGKVRSAD